MNELSEILRISEDVGVAIVVIIFGYLMVRAIITGVVKVMEIWERTALARLQVDTKRNELDDRMVEAVTQLAASHERIDAKTGATQALISSQAHESRMAHGTTQAAVERVEMSMQGSTEKSSHQHKRIVEAVAANGSKLDELKALVDDLTNKITSGVVSSEIAQALSKISLKLDECISTKTYKVPESSPPVVTGEQTTDKEATQEA